MKNYFLVLFTDKEARNLKRFISSLLLGIMLVGSASAVSAGEPADFSGIAPLSQSTCISISDYKAKSDKHRVYMVRFEKSGYSVAPLEVDVWGDSRHLDEPNASDLEAICPVPGKTGEFFMAESGWWKNTAGRIFRVRIYDHPMRSWVGSVEEIIHPFPAPADGITPDAQQIEAISAIDGGDGTTILILGLRGNANTPATLVFGKLKNGQYTVMSKAQFCLHELLPGCRSCSDMTLRPNADNSYSIIVSGAVDQGDLGPFNSVVCRIGTVAVDKGQVRFRLDSPSEIHHVEGLKVEAITAAPAPLPDASVIVGTDDESYAPIIRPLPKVPAPTAAPCPPKAK